jgi:hypothetical protein
MKRRVLITVLASNLYSVNAMDFNPEAVFLCLLSAAFNSCKKKSTGPQEPSSEQDQLLQKASLIQVPQTICECHDTGPLMPKKQQVALARKILERLPNSPVALKILEEIEVRKEWDIVSKLDCE